jgi:hypothetical protein
MLMLIFIPIVDRARVCADGGCAWHMVHGYLSLEQYVYVYVYVYAVRSFDKRTTAWLVT